MVYVLSDIHGQLNVFNKILSKIGFASNDHLYILGDAIDRGPDGVDILQEVMKANNITLLIGNHEHMMLDAIRTGLNHDYDLWFHNGGYITYSAYKDLTDEKQIQIVEYLRNCPLVIPRVEVNNRKFYLTHAGWLARKSELLYKDAFVFDIEEATWDRYFAMNPQKAEMFDGYRIIFGHTPTTSLPYGRANSKHQPLISYCKNAVAIDCGMMNPEYGQLGCLRLNDFREFYVGGKIK